jgi:hypothetical protein
MASSVEEEEREFVCPELIATPAQRTGDHTKA